MIESSGIKVAIERGIELQTRDNVYSNVCSFGRLYD